jgi:hypothetical protein
MTRTEALDVLSRLLQLVVPHLAHASDTGYRYVIVHIFASPLRGRGSLRNSVSPLEGS